MATRDLVTATNRIKLSDVHERESVTLSEMEVGSVSVAITTSEIVRNNPGNIEHPVTP